MPTSRRLVPLHRGIQPVRSCLWTANCPVSHPQVTSPWLPTLSSFVSAPLVPAAATLDIYPWTPQILCFFSLDLEHSLCVNLQLFQERRRGSTIYWLPVVFQVECSVFNHSHDSVRCLLTSTVFYQEQLRFRKIKRHEKLITEKSWNLDSLPPVSNLFHFFQFTGFVLVTQRNRTSELSHLVGAVSAALCSSDRLAFCVHPSARGLPPPLGLPFCSSALGLCWRNNTDSSRHAFYKGRVLSFVETKLPTPLLTPHPEPLRCPKPALTVMSSFSGQPSRKPCLLMRVEVGEHTDVPLCPSPQWAVAAHLPTLLCENHQADRVNIATPKTLFPKNWTTEFWMDTPCLCFCSH